MIYMTHPEHGANNFYGENEALEAEKNGWIRSVFGKEAITEEPVIIEEREPKRKPGRPKLQKGE